MVILMVAKKTKAAKAAAKAAKAAATIAAAAAGTAGATPNGAAVSQGAGKPQPVNIGTIVAGVADYCRRIPPKTLWTAVVVVVVATLIFWFLRYLRRADKRIAKAAAIAAALFRELSSGHSKGHDKKLFAMLHPKLVAAAEKELIRAMARCLREECGEFETFDLATLSVSEGKARSGEHVMTVSGRANFTKMRGVRLSTSWTVENKRPYFVNFTAEPPASAENPSAPKTFDVLKYVDPHEFEGFCEEFIFSLFKKEPTHALSVMCESLRNKYNNDVAALAKEVIGVISVAGGLKTRTATDLAVETAVHLTKPSADDGSEASKINGVELQFRVAGKTRDIRATVRIAFQNKKAQVVRYTMQALKSDTQNLIVDQETGEKIVV